MLHGKYLNFNNLVEGVKILFTEAYALFFNVTTTKYNVMTSNIYNNIFWFCQVYLLFNFN